MAELKPTMPLLKISEHELRKWGKRWLSAQAVQWKRKNKRGKLTRNITIKQKHSFNRFQSVNFCSVLDRAFGTALATFLGDIPVRRPNGDSLLPPMADCVEVGPARIVGGIRPQNYDAAYRPDGPRVVLDSKSLNDAKSIGKNWQNMINDLATESATIHTRFPYAIVCFLIVLPKPAVALRQAADILLTLERLGSRKDVLDQHHLAESIALVIWDPETGKIDETFPPSSSNVSLTTFSSKIARAYTDRYKGLPPHGYAKTAPGDELESDEEEPQEMAAVGQDNATLSSEPPAAVQAALPLSVAHDANPSQQEAVVAQTTD